MPPSPSSKKAWAVSLESSSFLSHSRARSRQAGIRKGTVRDSRGALLNNYSVFVFPTNPALWTAGSRYVRVVPSNAVSEFSVEGLPPERYFVVATRSLGLFQIYDRVRLKSLSRDAERILVGETDRSTVELVFRE